MESRVNTASRGFILKLQYELIPNKGDDCGMPIKDEIR